MQVGERISRFLREILAKSGAVVNLGHFLRVSMPSPKRWCCTVSKRKHKQNKKSDRVNRYNQARWMLWAFQLVEVLLEIGKAVAELL